MKNENLVDVIHFDMQYRDGGNWKTHHLMRFQDSTRSYSEDTLKHFFKQNVARFEEPIYAQDFNLDSIAPVENEFMEGGEYDHCFMEVLDITVKDQPRPDQGYPEINDWVNHVRNLNQAKLQAMKDNRKQEAKDIYRKKLVELSK